MSSAARQDATREARPPSKAVNDGAGVPAEAARPVHLYDAVSTQRDHVLGSFDAQRAAILKAVSDQREAALAPIKSVQARQSSSSPAAPNAGVRGQPGPRLLVAAEIVAQLKAMVAEEVRLQLLALLEAAVVRRNEAAHLDDEAGAR